MNNVYLLSGPPRTAKTTIMKTLVAATNVQLIAADALKHGVRNILTGQPHQMLRHIEIHGTAEHKASFTGGGEFKPFSNKRTEAELMLQTIEGMLDYYRRSDESVAFEGTDFYPAWVASLTIPGLTIKAAYVGFTNASHIENILEHARNNPHDWINDWLQDDQGDDTNIRTWAQDQAEKCQQLKLDAEAHGYPFFDISAQPFAAYKSSVLNFYLEK